MQEPLHGSAQIAQELADADFQTLLLNVGDVEPALLAWKPLRSCATETTRLCDLADACEAAHSASASGARAKNLRSRGFFAIAGEQTLRAHVYEADGVYVSMKDIEAHAQRLATRNPRPRKPEPIANLKSLTAPYKHAGHEPDLDHHVAVCAQIAWNAVAAASPTLERNQCEHVPAKVRGVHPSVPATAVSIYVARSPSTRTAGVSDKTVHDANAATEGSARTMADIVRKALRDGLSAHKWHVDHMDGWLAVITNAGLNLCTRLRSSLTGGLLLILLGVTARPHALDECFEASKGADAVAQWLSNASAAGGGQLVRPIHKRALLTSIVEGRALILIIDAGTTVVGEMNKLWHCVLALDMHADAHLVRLAFILYVHWAVCRVERLLQQPGAQIARFDTADLCQQWRLKNSLALPARLVRNTEYAYDWATLVKAHPPLALDRSVFESMEYTTLDVGNLQIRFSTGPLTIWLAHEVVERVVCGFLCSSRQRTDQMATHNADWPARWAFIPNLRSPEEPRQGLMFLLETHYQRSAWADCADELLDARTFLVRCVSTQVGMDTLAHLLVYDQDCFALDAAEDGKTVAESTKNYGRLERIMRAMRNGRHRQRLQPLSATKCAKNSKQTPLFLLLANVIRHPKLIRDFGALLRKAGSTCAKHNIVRPQLFKLLQKFDQIGEVYATVMVREAKCAPQCGSGLFCAPLTVKYGDAPASRILPFVHPDDVHLLRNKSLLRLCAMEAAVHVCKGARAHMRTAWKQQCKVCNDLKPYTAYIKATLLAVQPFLDDVENWLCESGKAVVARSGLPLLRGQHRGEERSEWWYSMFGVDDELGPLVYRLEDGHPVGFQFWAHHGTTSKE